MSLKLGSTLLGVGRDDDRLSPGFTLGSGVVVFGGLVMSQLTTDVSGKTLAVFNGVIDATHPLPLGLVIENTNPFPRSASGDADAGVGFDSLDYARGGLYSVFHRPGNFADISDDGRDRTVVARTANAGPAVNQQASAPFIITDPWAIGVEVYSTPQGLLTTVVPAGAPGTIVAVVGYIRAVFGTGSTLKLALELQLHSLVK
jgi:hypothetical protein